MSEGTQLEALGVSWGVAGTRILGQVDLTVRDGQCLVVVGPNGAGKTTLLRLLAGLLEPTEGRLLCRRTEYRELSRRELARQIAYVPQSRPLRVPLTVEKLVLLGRFPYLSPFRLSPTREDFSAVHRALELAGIAHLGPRLLEELSGGERQSAYIAAALAQSARILILDEPTTHLDPRHQRQVASLLARLNREEGLTLVVATHDLQFAALIADEIVALREGKLLAMEPPAQLLRPERLAEIFDAPFQVVEARGRRVMVLELGE